MGLKSLKKEQVDLLINSYTQKGFDFLTEKLCPDIKANPEACYEFLGKVMSNKEKWNSIIGSFYNSNTAIEIFDEDFRRNSAVKLKNAPYWQTQISDETVIRTNEKIKDAQSREEAQKAVIDKCCFDIVDESLACLCQDIKEQREKEYFGNIRKTSLNAKQKAIVTEEETLER